MPNTRSFLIVHGVSAKAKPAQSEIHHTRVVAKITVSFGRSAVVPLLIILLAPSINSINPTAAEKIAQSGLNIAAIPPTNPAQNQIIGVALFVLFRAVVQRSNSDTTNRVAQVSVRIVDT